MEFEVRENLKHLFGHLNISGEENNVYDGIKFELRVHANGNYNSYEIVEKLGHTNYKVKKHLEKTHEIYKNKIKDGDNRKYDW